MRGNTGKLGSNKLERWLGNIFRARLGIKEFIRVIKTCVWFCSYLYALLANLSTKKDIIN